MEKFVPIYQFWKTSINPWNRFSLAIIILLIFSLDNNSLAQTACFPEWSSTSVYTKGSQASKNGNNYTAQWWTQNEDPELRSGQYDVWKLEGPCGGTSNVNPSSSITSPTNGSSFTAPASIVINANATDPDGSISKVEFFNGSIKLGEDVASPYSFNWTNVQAGSYTLTVRATDNVGGTGNSSAISITVTNSTTNTPPTVNLSSPANGTSFIAPASISISANASDANGSVSKVEFYNGSSKLGEDLSSPYTYNWSNVAAGTYSLTAKATDNQGSTTTSSAISITVTSSTGGCTDPQYVENGGYVAGSRVQNAGNSYQCKPDPYSGWCNGAAWAYGPGTGTYWTDAWTLIGPCTGTNNNPPSVGITSPANNTQFSEGSTVAISATASDGDGSVAKVEFFVDGSKIGEDASTPYSISWASTQGSHTLMAKATDNNGNTKESSLISITVGTVVSSGLPKHIMSGYWHSWGGGAGGGVPFVKLRDVNSGWDVINISFAEPISPGSSDGKMKFEVTGLTSDYTINDFKADIKTLQSRGKKVVLSIGGYAGYFSLGSSTAVTQFVNDIKSFINEYGFDGIDIDLEQSSVQFNPGADPDFKNPTSPKVVNMISAIRQIVNSYPSSFILSWAPETFYLQMGHQWYGGSNANVDARSGVYIPMIHALRDKTTYVQAQLYNSMQMQGNDGVMYSMGTVEGIVAMTEMLIQGFTVGGNSNSFFPGLRPDQVVIAVPASQGAAGSGQISNSGLQQAFGTVNSHYPGLRGIMAWSINWDAYQNNNSFVSSNSSYLKSLPTARVGSPETSTVSLKETSGLTIYPNPVNQGGRITLVFDSEPGDVSLQISETNGLKSYQFHYKKVKKSLEINLPFIDPGMYIFKASGERKVWIEKVILR